MIGDRIRQIRRHEGISMAALARWAGLTTKTVFDIEHNNTEPTEATLRKLAKALNVSLADLVEEAELPNRMLGCFMTLPADDQRLALQVCERLSSIPRTEG